MTASPAARTRPWRGVLVATALPYRDDLSVDFDAYADHVRLAGRERLPRRGPERLAGRVPGADQPRSARRSSRWRSRPRPTGFVVMPGVGAYGALEARRWAEQAAEAGAQAVMALPPNAYRADERAVVEHYREIAKAGLPVVGVQQPDRHQDRPDARTSSPRCTTRASSSGVKEFSGDVRRAYEIAELGARTGPADRHRRRRARGRHRRAPRGWVAGIPERLPARRAWRCTRPASAGTWHTALPLYRLLHPLLRWDSKTEFVQAIKLSMDIVGRTGGACRPPRQPLTAEQEQPVRAATEAALEAGLA